MMGYSGVLHGPIERPLTPTEIMTLSNDTGNVMAKV